MAEGDKDQPTTQQATDESAQPVSNSLLSDKQEAGTSLPVESPTGIGPRVVKELPPPPPEIMEPTVCETHVSLRQKIDPKDLEGVGRFEEDKNCCPDCERKRVEEWGNPTDDDIKQKAVGYRLVQQSDPEVFRAFRAEAIRFAEAREKEDREGLDMMTWSQFKGCERDGLPFWTSGDYKRLLKELGIVSTTSEGS